ncbi:MAG: PKD domain-containing protein [Candidatus Thermoplasmatota archaeon]|nr:PKD domain-containing protein [Candidatus Thermoplasmatota archaeon]
MTRSRIYSRIASVISLTLVLSMLMTGSSSPASGSDPPLSRWSVVWDVEQEFEVLSWADTGNPMIIEIDGTERTVSPAFDPFSLLDGASKDAVRRSPQWLNSSLTMKLLSLDASTGSKYSALINDGSIPKQYIDEIAFSIASAPKEVLSHPLVDPMVFLDNVVAMYSMDAHLDYVRIVDSDHADGQRSTVEYRLQSGNRTLPHEIYYKYLVPPINTMELPSYIDPDSRSHSDRANGSFWRSHLFNMTDDPGYPILKDYLKNQTYLWKGNVNDLDDNGALGAAARWQREVMPQFGIPPEANRTKQPIVHYKNHWGMCGENSDLLTASLKIALIPAVQVVDFGTWHAWNHFYEDGWHLIRAYDGRVDDPFAEGSPGAVSAFSALDPDGSVFDATSLYTFTSNMTVNVLDAHGIPVDGALVVVGTEDSFNNPYGIGLIANTTDASGAASFKVGFNFDYYVRVISHIGDHPETPGTLTLAYPLAGIGQDHFYNVTLNSTMFPFMNEPVNASGQDARYTLLLNDLRQRTRSFDDHLLRGNTLERNGSSTLPVMVLNDENLTLFRSGLGFIPSYILLLEPGKNASLVLDGPGYNIVAGALSPNTISFVSMRVLIESAVVVPDAIILSPSPGTYYSDETITFTGGLLPGESDRVTYLWTSSALFEPISEELEFSMSLPIRNHTITFTVFHDGVFASKAKVDISVVRRNAPPVANISSPIEGEKFLLGTSISFYSEGTLDPDGDPLTYVWSDMDRNEIISLSSGFSMRFAPGTHNVSLNVSDGLGGYGTDTVTFSVVPGNNPPSSFITSPASGSVFYSDTRIIFSGGGSYDIDGDPITFSWSSSIDGLLSEEMEFDTFLSIGDHTVTLNVSDGELFSFSSVIVSVIERPPPVNLPPVANISSPIDGSHYGVMEYVTFESEGSFDPEGAEIQYSWFVDGIHRSVEPTFSMRLPAGLHSIRLMVWDGELYDNASARVLVIDMMPVMVLRINGTIHESGLIRVKEGENVTFDMSDSFDPDMTSLTYLWRLDDVNISTDPSVKLSFAPGTYTLEHIVMDGTGLDTVGSVPIVCIAREIVPPEEEGVERTDMWIWVPVLIIAVMLLLTIVFLLLRRRLAYSEE